MVNKCAKFQSHMSMDFENIWSITKKLTFKWLRRPQRSDDYNSSTYCYRKVELIIQLFYNSFYTTTFHYESIYMYWSRRLTERMTLLFSVLPHRNKTLWSDIKGFFFALFIADIRPYSQLTIVYYYFSNPRDRIPI
jgi:hypothetical protein